MIGQVRLSKAGPGLYYALYMQDRLLHVGVARRRVDELKIESLKEFVVFSRYLSFTAAARHLYVSQPALSYRIAAMEKEFHPR